MNQFRAKIRLLSLKLLTLVICSGIATAQTPRKPRAIFFQAENHFLYEEYELANDLYLLLDVKDNLNIKYKIGVCYLNIPDEKEKAIPYLEAAVRNASYDAKPGSFREKRAPLDAWFFLAKAHMINNDLEKGLETFQKFNSLAKATEDKGGMQNLGFIDQETQACRNAISSMENPVMITKRNLGADFNQGAMNENPAVSFDGNTMVFTERRGMVNVIYFSKKIRGKWQSPIDITGQLQAGDDCSSSSLNTDGTELFLYKRDNYDGNIYQSKFTNNKWTPITRLNSNVNTRFYESHASVSSDGKKLYFTSNREGGQGGLDIYVTERDASGDWGMPVNLGTTINTKYNEDNPFLTSNDSTLYFCSEGHNSIGGFDNFKSNRLGTVWQTPQNLGFPVNTTDDDKFFQPSDNGMYAYYSLKTAYKKRDIFYLGLGGVDVALEGDSSMMRKTEKIDLENIPVVAAIDSSILIKNMNVQDVNENEAADPNVLYYTVQVMALYNPVDVSYFKYINDLKVMFNEKDMFYRYTTGIFKTREAADEWKQELLRIGYPDDIWVKKVLK
jgi:hypothetical protein